MESSSLASHREVVILVVGLGSPTEAAFAEACDRLELAYSSSDEVATRCLKDAVAPPNWRGWECESGRDSAFEAFEWSRAEMHLRFVRRSLDDNEEETNDDIAQSAHRRVRACIGLDFSGSRGEEEVARVALAEGVDPTRCECAALPSRSSTAAALAEVTRVALAAGADPTRCECAVLPVDAADLTQFLDSVMVGVMVALHADAQLASLERSATKRSKTRRRKHTTSSSAAASSKKQLALQVCNGTPLRSVLDDPPDSVLPEVQRARRVIVLAELALLCGCPLEACFHAADGAAETRSCDAAWHAQALTTWAAALLALGDDHRSSDLIAALEEVPQITHTSTSFLKHNNNTEKKTDNGAAPMITIEKKKKKTVAERVEAAILAVVGEALLTLRQHPKVLGTRAVELGLKLARWQASSLGKRRETIWTLDATLAKAQGHVTGIRYSRAAAAAATIARFARCPRKAALYAARGAFSAMQRRDWNEATCLWRLVPAEKSWSVIELAAVRGLADAAECSGDYLGASEAWARVLEINARLQAESRSARARGSLAPTFHGGGLSKGSRVKPTLALAVRRRQYADFDATSSAAQKSALMRLENSPSLASRDPQLIGLQKVLVEGPSNGPVSKASKDQWTHHRQAEVQEAPTTSNFIFNPFEKKRRDEALLLARASNVGYEGLWVKGEEHEVQVVLTNRLELNLELRSATLAMTGTSCASRPLPGKTRIASNSTKILVFSVRPLECGELSIAGVLVTRGASRFLAKSSTTTTTIRVVEAQPMFRLEKLGFLRPTFGKNFAPPPTSTTDYSKVFRAGESVSIKLSLTRLSTTPAAFAELWIKVGGDGAKRQVFWRSIIEEVKKDPVARLVNGAAFKAALLDGGTRLLELTVDLNSRVGPASSRATLQYSLGLSYASSTDVSRDLTAHFTLRGHPGLEIIKNHQAAAAAAAASSGFTRLELANRSEVPVTLERGGKTRYLRAREAAIIEYRPSPADVDGHVDYLHWKIEGTDQGILDGLGKIKLPSSSSNKSPS